MFFRALTELLRSDGSIMINKSLARHMGLEATIVYSELLSRYCYFRDRGLLTADDWFFNTVDDLEEGTTLSDYQQRKAIKTLEELKLIETDRRDVPAKRYFRINEDCMLLNNLILRNSSSSSQKTKELDIKKLQSNNTKNNTKEIIPPKGDAQKPLIVTPDKKAKKAKDIVTMKSMTYAFTNNEDIQDKLMEYFYIRVKKSLQPNQWQIILDDLRAFAGDNASIALDKINGAIAGGYMQIIPSWEKDKKSNINKPKFDNTAGREVQAAVNLTKEEFSASLAIDEQGNPLQF